MIKKKILSESSGFFVYSFANQTDAFKCTAACGGSSDFLFVYENAISATKSNLQNNFI